jgi:hypothetical protein
MPPSLGQGHHCDDWGRAGPDNDLHSVVIACSWAQPPCIKLPPPAVGALRRSSQKAKRETARHELAQSSGRPNSPDRVFQSVP